MKQGVSSLAALFLLLCSAAAAAPASVSLNEYQAHLRELAEKIDSLRDHPERAAAVETAIPDTLAVTTDSGGITVDYRDLKGQLSMLIRANPSRREALISQLSNYVRVLESQAVAYRERGADSEQARKALQGILARHEFRHARQSPSLINLLLAKVFGWILRLLEHLGFGTASGFSWFQIFLYGFLAAVLGMLLIWTVRRLRRKPADSGAREIVPFAPSARSWRTWLDEARSLAEREDWRGAIHQAYWAGISFLEAHGAWRPNRARTAREYLRLLTSRNPNYSALASLTHEFEVVWYGNRKAMEADFTAALGQLEKLGCR